MDTCTNMTVTAMLYLCINTPNPTPPCYASDFNDPDKLVPFRKVYEDIVNYICHCQNITTQQYIYCSVYEDNSNTVFSIGIALTVITGLTICSCIIAIAALCYEYVACCQRIKYACCQCIKHGTIYTYI